jgi:uncharacterized membrane protein YkvA (DUF1232 family)
MAKKAPTKRTSRSTLPEGIDKKFVRRGAQKVTDRDIKKVTERADDIRKKFSRGGPLRRFLEDLELLLSIVRDYWSGTYRKIPYWAVGAIVFALLYVLNPVDLIPDVIPFVGLLDDAAVVAVCLTMVEQELHDYKQWKESKA